MVSEESVTNPAGSSTTPSLLTNAPLAVELTPVLVTPQSAEVPLIVKPTIPAPTPKIKDVPEETKPTAVQKEVKTVSAPASPSWGEVITGPPPI